MDHVSLWGQWQVEATLGHYRPKRGNEVAVETLTSKKSAACAAWRRHLWGDHLIRAYQARFQLLLVLTM